MNDRSQYSVYFDTSAWNFFYDWLSRKSKKYIRGPEYLFSSCNLDEFAMSGQNRARELASFAWNLSNRKKLLDHVEFTFNEIVNYQLGNQISGIYDEDPPFHESWRIMRKGSISSELKRNLKELSRFSKGVYRDQLRSDRDIFKPIFESAKSLGFQKTWPELLREMEHEGYIGALIINLLEQEGYISQIPEPNSIGKIPYRELPCTAAWIQYYLSLFHLASFEKGKLSKPDLGDQVDFRHACYAGLADIFVTDDQRMFTVLTDMVETKRAGIIKPEEYITWLQNHR